jgi:hypothetical protein
LLVTAGNCSYAEAREMTLTDYNRLVRYWNRHPPTHLLVAALFSSADSDSSAHSNGRSVNRPTFENESFESLMSRWAGTPGTGTR